MKPWRVPRCIFVVMAGLVLACPGHPRLFSNRDKNVDARHEAGHDQRKVGRRNKVTINLAPSGFPRNRIDLAFMESPARHVSLVPAPDRRQSETALAIPRGTARLCRSLGFSSI